MGKRRRSDSRTLAQSPKMNQNTAKQSPKAVKKVKKAKRRASAGSVVAQSPAPVVLKSPIPKSPIPTPKQTPKATKKAKKVKRRSSTGSVAAQSPKLVQKSPIGKKSPKTAGKGKKADKDAANADNSSVNVDVLREITKKLMGTSTMYRLGMVNKASKLILEKQLDCPEAKVVDLEMLVKEGNPLMDQFYDCQEKQHRLKFHADVRRAITQLQNIADCLPGNDNCIKNLTVRALGWLYCYNDSEIHRCPPLLQKRIMKLIAHNFSNTFEFEYAKSFLRPSRFFAMFKHRLSTITKLDLGDMKPLKATGLRKSIFPRLTNLKEFIWHRAELWFVKALPAPHKLESLCVTLNKNRIDAESLSVLLNCQGLSSLYTGICVPDNPTRFDWDVLLTSYQAFWNQRQYVPEDMFVEKGLEPVLLAEGHDADYAYRAFPALKKVGFWNCPEYLFVTMGKMGVCYEEVQLGLLTQDLSCLCSLDSVMQALFKYNQPKYNINKLAIDHLKLYTHSMPVISLDYYLPNLMVALGQALPTLKSLELSVRCIAGCSAMPSSWLLDSSRPKRPRAIFEDLTHFSFQIDGFCMLDDLDVYLPTSTHSVSLSFIASPMNKRRFLASLEKFIEHLGDFNRFPDLDELHIQVWGVACLEQLMNAVIDHVPSLRRLSIICLPVNKQLSVVADLIGHCANKCKNLTELALSADLVNQLLTSEEKKDPTQWKSALFSLGDRCGIERNCTITVNSLPATEGWNHYDVKPIHPAVEVEGEEDVEDGMETSDDATDDDEEEIEFSQSDGEEEDSFVVENEDDVEFEESEDELDRAERALDGESNRRDRRWQARRVRVLSEGSEASEHSGDVIVFRRGEKGEEDLDEEEEESESENPFLDDMAEERDGSTSAEDESEPEGENLAGSDDEDLLSGAVELVNARARRQPAPKRRRIISDSD